MTKKIEQLKDSYNDIPIPSNLNKLIQQSMLKGFLEIQKKNRRLQWIVSTLSVAVLVFALIISVTAFPKVQMALHQIPVVGKQVASSLTLDSREVLIYDEEQQQKQSDVEKVGFSIQRTQPIDSGRILNKESSRLFSVLNQTSDVKERASYVTIDGIEQRVISLTDLFASEVTLKQLMDTQGAYFRDVATRNLLKEVKVSNVKITGEQAFYMEYPELVLQLGMEDQGVELVVQLPKLTPLLHPKYRK
ncbi:MAG: hypothetical protein ACRC5C_03050 [Bacilli bacterium]